MHHAIYRRVVLIPTGVAAQKWSAAHGTRSYATYVYAHLRIDVNTISSDELCVIAHAQTGAALYLPFDLTLVSCSHD